MQTITKQQLKDFGACEDGLNRFILQTGNTDEPVTVASLIGGHNTTSDLLWLAGKTLPKDKIVRFACDCALLNIELIKPYTQDYELIHAFLRNPNAAAAGAADTAWGAAASAARSAAWYAAGAARSAASAAAWGAARSAASAASAAARYAAGAAGGDINPLLEELFK